MATTTASSPRRGRGWRIAGGVLLACVAVIGVCEWMRWPFLVKPVEKMLGDTLQRRVLLQDEGASAERAGVRFIGHLRVWVPALQIDAPGWSRQPYFLRAEQAHLVMRYTDLIRAARGGAIDIDRLDAGQLTVHAEREKDGRASWTFGDPNKPKPEKEDADFAMPNVRHLTVRSGDVTYADAILKADIRGHVELDESANGDTGSAAAGQRGLVATAEGTYVGAQLKARLTSAGAMPLLATGENAPSTPVTVSLKSGRTQVSFDGTVQDVLNFKGMSGVVKASGTSLADAGAPFGVTLPSTGAFTVDGKIVKQDLLWRFVTDKTRVGESRLNAALTYDTRGRKPSLSGRVTSPDFKLADLLPTVAGDKAAAEAPPVTGKGQAAARASQVIPDKEFDLPSLRAMDANVLFAFDHAELGSAFAMPLDPLKAHLILSDGKLAIRDIDARTADGQVAGEVSLDGTGKTALYRTDIRWSGVKLEKWLKQDRGGDAPPYISGTVGGRAKLAGEGRSTAQILGSLDGSVFAAMRGGRISHLVMEGAGLDIAQAIGVLIKGDEALRLQCAVIDLKADDGVLRPRAAIFDTPDSTVWVDGSISLTTEALDLRAVVSPKDFSPLALRTPVKVGGSFGAPAISLQKDKLAKKLGAAAVLALVNPLAAVIPLIDPGEGDDRQACSQVLDRAKRTASSLPQETSTSTADSGTPVAAAPQPPRQ